MATSAIDAFLAEPAIAIAGMSRSGRKFGNVAARTLAAKGYRIYPVHPSATEIDGRRCYRTLRDLPEPVGALLVVVPPPQVPALLEQAAAAGIKKVWLQQGAESVAAIQTARRLGLDLVSRECVLMFASPTGVHKAHRWLRGMLGTIPA